MKPSLWEHLQVPVTPSFLVGLAPVRVIHLEQMGPFALGGRQEELICLLASGAFPGASLPLHRHR